MPVTLPAPDIRYLQLDFDVEGSSCVSLSHRSAPHGVDVYYIVYDEVTRTVAISYSDMPESEWETYCDTLYYMLSEDGTQWAPVIPYTSRDPDIDPTEVLSAVREHVINYSFRNLGSALQSMGPDDCLFVEDPDLRGPVFVYARLQQISEHQGYMDIEKRALTDAICRITGVEPPPTAGVPMSAYGFCPHCGLPGHTRERRINGNDTCEGGHIYPSRSSLDLPPDVKIPIGSTPSIEAESSLFPGLGSFLDTLSEF
tara:strand:- start:14435 stop:15202 length:768 start_codon:yes stop_codon:yes gene_type:complete